MSFLFAIPAYVDDVENVSESEVEPPPLDNEDDISTQEDEKLLLLAENEGLKKQLEEMRKMLGEYMAKES